MSRRNSASRRRSYGRRLHELNQRRPQRETFRDWIDAADLDISLDGAGQASEQAMWRDWMSPGGRGSSRP